MCSRGLADWTDLVTLGFNYEFDALNANEKPNELNVAFSTMLSASQRLSLLPLLQSRFPLLRVIVSTMDL